MLQIEIEGTPIGGEDSRESSWVERIVNANRLPDVTLRFRLEPHRKVDLDNLVRPAMRALRISRYYTNGFPELCSLSAKKEFGGSVGLTIEAGAQLCPDTPLLETTFDSIPPSEAAAEWKEQWRNSIQAGWAKEPLMRPVWISLATTSKRSLVDLLKPIIDGLEPLLGRDPSGRLQFCPNDEFVHWLQIRRTEVGPALHLTAGVLD